MSKSLGNFFTLKEVLDRYPADAVRLLMLQTHYRSALDFSFERLDGSVGTLERVRATIANLRWASESAPQDGELNEADRALGAAIDQAVAEFGRQMDDDFNTSGALAAIFGLVTAANTYLADAGQDTSTALALRASDTLVELLGVLGVESVRQVQLTELPHELVALAATYAGYAGDDVADAAQALVAARSEARAARDWSRADAIRDAVEALGLALEDTACGTRIKPATREA